MEIILTLSKLYILFNYLPLESKVRKTTYLYNKGPWFLNLENVQGIKKCVDEIKNDFWMASNAFGTGYLQVKFGTIKLQEVQESGEIFFVNVHIKQNPMW